MVIIIIFIIIVLLIINARTKKKNARITICISCGWKGSWERYSQRNGCPNCGSDLHRFH